MEREGQNATAVDDVNVDIDLGIDGLSDYVEIGAGGFATVFASFDHRFQRWVAVKALHTVSAADRRRFERELAVMGRLGDHDNVVTPYRSGSTPTGAPYLVMELVEGGSLDQHVKSHGPMPVREAIDVIVPIANALQHAHGLGILHRDIKPANIMLTLEGTPKLSDFGIAAVQEATVTHRSFTLAHAPPETFEETERRDERSDLYSLASSFYTVVVGQPPFQASTETSVEGLIGRIVTKPVPTVGHPALDTFLVRAMAKNLDDRYQSAAEIIAALESVRETDVADWTPTANPSRAAIPTGDAPSTIADPRPPTPPAGSRFQGPNSTPRPTSGPRPRGLRLGATRASVPRSRLRFFGIAAAFLIAGFGVLVTLRASGESDEPQLQTVGGAAESGPSSTAIAVPAESDAASTVPPTPEPTVVEAEEPLVFVGHPDFVDQVLALPDDRVISVSTDGSLMMWDPETPGAEPVVFAENVGTVPNLVLLPDDRFATGSFGGELKIWDPAVPGDAPLTFRAESGIASVAALPYGRIAAMGAIVQIWDLHDPSADPLEFVDHGVGVSSLVSLTDERVATVDIDGTIMVWEPYAPQADPIVISGHDGSVMDMVALPDGRLVTAGADGTIQISNPDEPGDDPIVLRGHTDVVNDLVLLSDGRIASGSADGSIRIWDPVRPDLPPVMYTDSESSVWVLAALDDGRIASGWHNGMVRVWDPDDPTASGLQLFPGHTSGVSDLDVLSDGRVVSGSHDTTVRMWPGGQ